MSLRPLDLSVKRLHEESHARSVKFPCALLKEVHHLVDASLDVLHAFMLIHIVEFKLASKFVILSGLLILFHFLRWQTIFGTNEFLELLIL